MRVLFVSMVTRWTPLYETELELMQAHLDAGDEVVQLACGGELLACDFNSYHGIDRCRWCRETRDCGVKLLDGRVEQRPLLRLTAAQRAEIRGLHQGFADMEKLKACRIEAFDIGFAVLSSIISASRDPHVDVSADRTLVARLMMSALAVYRSVQNLLSAERFDRVYVFNARFASTRAVLRACQSRSVECVGHDRGHDLSHYALYSNALPHDVNYITRETKRVWEAAANDPDARRKTAEGFFLSRAAGSGHWWYSFTAAQKAGQLPADWDPARRNIVVFTSSEDEFAAIGDLWRNPLYPNQVEGLEAIVHALTDKPTNMHLYIRVHPNLKGIDNADVRRLMALKADFLTTIPAEADVSSYALMQAATTVLTFGSTIGTESVFWGKPSILAGQSYYRQLGGCYIPTSHADLVKLLLADLAPQDSTPALMYGYYLATYGYPYCHYRPKDVGRGEFKGIDLEEKEYEHRLAGRTWLDRLPPPLGPRLRHVRDLLFILATRYRVCRRLGIYEAAGIPSP